ncbi:unnamed protein product [Phaedon cochleariae]|uniref:Protein TsetseEP domain-containing protein n=1 Tax=Phaedon cochleariae TaxID=80249 RepID=A0A9P0DLH5_PHACE|nr:unnamed protein product [Phaedon cochleariae]
MRTIMSLLALSSYFLNTLVVNQSIPTQAEQANLLANVQEVFEQVKLLTKDIAESTEKSVVNDIGITVTRAEYTLDLLEKITLMRLSCDGNSVCMLESRPVIKQLAQDGRKALGTCTDIASADITACSDRLANVTNSAIDRGQQLLDALGECSKKPGLAVISCYRNIIATDVLPVKKTLVGAIETHREAHFKAIEIREKGQACVDLTVKKYRDLLEKVLEEALKCT